MDLNNKVAIITGGSRGIGKGIAIKMAEAGADVAIFYKSNHEQAEETLNRIRSIGRKAIMFPVDVSDKDEVNRAIDKAIEFFGGIDIFVNNAGITRDHMLLNMDFKDWQEVLNNNLNSAYYCSKAILKHMKDKGSGKIINVTSLSASVGNIGQTNYCAAKAGLVGFTKSLAAEVGKYGIIVNAIAPGAIQTDMLKHTPDPILEKMRNRIPLNRFGTPEDIGSMAVFLASEDSNYICGQTLTVDGGLGASIL
ncbi:3-oxoacyl-ACP reductase family protein [Fusibacter sp. 3D3]|uniref:3-oxoacyl-ACP reductase family protein n=1 Tax=Fusibacter sp. 3D3 TaxID=1048380 RepID=UPI0008536741|nr:3-oxoacyl-ACP reductase family protein [Fusibacter sp. 3D3]GAU79291.1 3-oxoacyl-[acyl-carrier protein] reductase [Fusibacter sp. 3D3]